MSPYQDALLGHFWIWALCHLFGLFLGFIVFETSYGTNTLQRKLVWSLRIAGALYITAGLGAFMLGNHDPWDAHVIAMSTLIVVHLVILYIAGDVRISPLN